MAYTPGMAIPGTAIPELAAPTVWLKIMGEKYGRKSKVVCPCCPHTAVILTCGSGSPG